MAATLKVLRSISEASENFRAAMSAAGITWNGQIVADGKLRRFKVEGDPAKNSWYIQNRIFCFGCGWGFAVRL